MPKKKAKQETSEDKRRLFQRIDAEVKSLLDTFCHKYGLTFQGEREYRIEKEFHYSSAKIGLVLLTELGYHPILALHIPKDRIEKGRQYNRTGVGAVDLAKFYGEEDCFDFDRNWSSPEFDDIVSFTKQSISILEKYGKPLLEGDYQLLEQIPAHPYYNP